MRTDLRNKVVLVTGASSGIGRATAVAYGEEGPGSRSRTTRTRTAPGRRHGW